MFPSLPIILSPGTVAVYGAGVTASTAAEALPSGLVLEPNYRAGTIYNIWDGGATYIYGGDVVYWKDGSQLTRIVTAENLTFTVLPCRLVTKDLNVPIP